MSKREAIGLSLCLNLFNVFTHQPQAVLAEEALKCQFTVASSGLEFCDNVVGNGLEATKGQLIKVIPSTYTYVIH